MRALQEHQWEGGWKGSGNLSFLQQTFNWARCLQEEDEPMYAGILTAFLMIQKMYHVLTCWDIFVIYWQGKEYGVPKHWPTTYEGGVKGRYEVCEGNRRKKSEENRWESRWYRPGNHITWYWESRKRNQFPNQ